MEARRSEATIFGHDENLFRNFSAPTIVFSGMGGAYDLSILKRATLRTYERNWPTPMSHWTHAQQIPRYFRSRFFDLPGNISVFDLLMRIRKELTNLQGLNGSPAHSFAESRFSSVKKVLANKINSCGALCTITGNVLRLFNIPVKFIHGRLTWQQKNDRHCWLQIYDPIGKRWGSVDPTSDDFTISLDYKAIKEYVNWTALKADYLHGDF